MENKHYTVRYKDENSDDQTFSTFAVDSYAARMNALDNICYLKEHPHSIVFIGIS